MKHYLILALALGLCCACDEEEPKQYGGTQPLDTPVITLVESEYNRLSFSWTPVEGAVDYSYKFTDAKGKLIAGDLVKDTIAEFEELSYSTEYQFTVLAYADVQSEKTTSVEAILKVKTPFYRALNDAGTYTSVILTTKTWKPTLVETRAEGEEDDFGTFTLQAWYGTSDYDLQFELDAKGNVKILNGTTDEATEWKLVLAGPSTIATNQYVRKGVLVDESRCSFDREAHVLQLYVRSTKDASREGYDSFEWDEE